MKRTVHFGFVLPAIALMMMAGGSSAGADDLRPEVSRALEQFDQCRTLAMRAVKNAQDLKTVFTYGRGFALDMPEAIAEDVHLEGTWLFDYLYTMDVTSASLHSYSSAKEHPNLQEELDAFRGYIPEAAARTAVFYEKTQRMLKDAILAVNEAAAAKAPFRLQTLPAASYPDVPPSIRNAVGDGFELGWCIAIRPQAYLHVLNLHGYPPDWLLKQAQEAGVSFIRPYDADLFDWSVVETEPGKYDWSKIDEAASMVVQHDLGLILPLLSFSDSPSDWLRQRIGDRAVLVGPDGKPITENRRRGDAFAFSQVSAKPERTPMNMFDGEVAEAFGRYAQALVRRLRDAGVRILAVELDSTLPWCAGEQATARFRRWLAENKIDPRARWGAQFDASGAIIPEKLQTAGTADPGQKRMMIDLVCWREQEYIDYLRPQVQALREIDRGLPLCSFSSEVAEANEAMTGRNNERLIRELGLIPLGFSLENIWDNLRRAYSPSHYSIAFTHAGAGDAEYGVEPEKLSAVHPRGRGRCILAVRHERLHPRHAHAVLAAAGARVHLGRAGVLLRSPMGVQLAAGLAPVPRARAGHGPRDAQHPAGTAGGDAVVRYVRQVPVVHQRLRGRHVRLQRWPGKLQQDRLHRLGADS